jgi:hypothetical protein
VRIRLYMSHEHERAATPPLGMYIAQADWETSAAGIGSMDPTLKALKAALEGMPKNGVEFLSDDTSNASILQGVLE